MTGPVPSQSILFVDAGEVLASAREKLRREGLDVEAVAWDAKGDWAAGLRIAPSVAVIGPSVPNPAGAARRLKEAQPLVHVVFVAPDGAEETLRRTLLYSAPPQTPWRLVPSRDGEVLAAVRSAQEAAGRARKVRTTLDRVNLRLAAPAPGDAHAWRKLRVSDRFLASVLKHAQDAIISLDVQGNVLSWNDGAAAVFGVRPQQAVGEPIDRVVGWQCSLRELVAAAVREGHVRSEVRCTVDGRELVIDATLSAVEEHRSEVVAVAAILRDVTEQVRTRATLAASEALFRTLADNIPQLAWIADETGSIGWYNRRWYEYTGTTLEQMAGWGWQAVHHPEHLDRVVARFRQHVASGEEWEDTFPLRGKDGEYRWFLSRAFPIRDASGRVRQWFGTNTDITQERAAQEALRQADQRKNEFISMLSHELRNPLAPIRNSIYLLERLPGDAPSAANARQVIRRQTDHLTRLVDDLLDVTRITSGKMVLARARTDLVEVVRAAAEDHRALIEAAGIELRVALPGREVVADVDAARLTQVMGNLLQNALKFSAAGGWIEVRMAVEEGWAAIGIRDCGAGIDPQLLGSLFEPFVQGERSMERSKGGLGLGLALAKGVVEMHGGRIEARSEGRDRGAEFTVRLPLGTAVHAPAARPAAETGAGPAKPQRVLIVDDNRDAADSLAQLVTLFGHQADVAHDGYSALARFEERRPDVVLCDIGLPGMNGYEIARRLRGMGTTARLVAVSGYAQPEDLRESAAAGFDQHVAKPPPPETIRRLLESTPAASGS